MFVRPKELARRIGISRRHLDRLADNDPLFPPKIRLSKRVVVFESSHVETWLDGKIKDAQGTGVEGGGQ